jgi:hypothetical protein
MDDELAKMFDLENARDFYAKLLAEFDDFMGDQSSARHAMNCAITAHHMYDWVWVDFLRDDVALRARLGIGNRLSEFASWCEEKSAWFAVVQQISNGTKHFIRKNAESFEEIGGFGGGGFGQGPFGESYLALDMQTEHVRYLPLSHIFEAVVRFWRDILIECGHGADLPSGRTKLSD